MAQQQLSATAAAASGFKSLQPLLRVTLALTLWLHTNRNFRIRYALQIDRDTQGGREIERGRERERADSVLQR